MSRKNSYYDLTASADCDSPSAVANLLARVDERKLRQSSDEGIMRLRISAPTNQQLVYPVFNTLTLAVETVKLGGELDIGVRRKGREDAIVLVSSDLPCALSRLRVGLRQQAEALSC